jgi:allophanate hydrolase subunit 2
VQIPPYGQPVVTLNDGPTVGGYAKIALVEAEDLDRLVQTRPGQRVQFQLVA